RQASMKEIVMRFVSVCTGVVLIAVAGLSGCATTAGSGYGVVRGGAERTGITFDWKRGDDVTGSMTAKFADGIVYSGEYFQVTSDARVDRMGPLWTGFSPAWRGWRGWYADPGPDFVKVYSGRVLANLAAPDGAHMRCRFQLVRPNSGMSGGGQGSCQLQ